MSHNQNPFDFYDVLVNVLFGDVWLVIIIGLIGVGYYCMKNKFPLQVTLAFCIFWTFIWFAANKSLLVLWVLIVLFCSFLFGYTVYKSWR